VTVRTTRQSDLIFETDRRLTLVEWSPRAVGALLRTDPADVAAGRIELRFTGAAALCLREQLDGVRITVSRSVPDAVTAVLGRGLRGGENVYLVASGTVTGWVVADGAHGLQHDVDQYEALSFAARGLGSRFLFSHGSAR
jgi:hypothetical protein